MIVKRYDCKLAVETVLLRYVVDGVWTVKPDGSKVWQSYEALNK